MSNDTRFISLPGSGKEPLPNARVTGDPSADQEFEVLVRVRRRQALPAPHDMPTLPADRTYLTRAEQAAAYGADPADLQKVADFAAGFGLTVVRTSGPECSVTLSGTAAAFNRAFQVDLKMYEHPSGTYRGRSGDIHIPAELEGIVTGVFGLDNRSFARPHVCIGPVGKAAEDRLSAVAVASVTGYTPLQIAQFYNFPTTVTGQGQTIGIIELGGGFRDAELQIYFANLGIQPPTVTVANLPNGGTNNPGTDALDPANPDIEVMLDIEVAGSIARGARIVVYFAKDASDAGFLDILSQTVHDENNAVDVISISWGGPEITATSQFQTNFNDVLQTAAQLGITVCVAAGDSGSADYPLDDPSRPWDGEAHVDFPASSPFALACGGTHILSAGPGTLQEEVWHPAPNVGTGGGVSRSFALPSYQAKAGVPAAVNPAGQVGRGVPDVAGNAAQESGYIVLCDGLNFPDPTHNPPLPPIGGTSAVAPLWAALIALINQDTGTKAGLIQPLLYGLTPAQGAFHDITVGNNGDYQAGPGWDPCTGLGTPNGQQLSAALRH
jgi:kumamolisin